MTGSIIFTARAFGIPVLGCDGVIAEDGSIAWTTPMSFSSVQYQDLPPARITQNAGTDVLLHYTMGSAAYPNERPYMFRFETEQGSQALFAVREFQDYPAWEDFDIHSSGLGVAITCGSGWRISVTTDFGATWSAPANIDYLYTLLGQEVYELQARFTTGMSVQVDEDTGTFYLLTSYSDGDYANYKFILLSSTDGLTWSLVQEWDNAALTYEPDTVSLAVSGGYIYVGFADSSYINPSGFFSADSGATWSTEYPFAVTLAGRVSFAAHGAIALAYFPIWNAGKTAAVAAVILRTTDGGATWTQTLRIDPPAAPPGPYPNYRQIRASGSLFATAFCRVRTPWNGASYTDGAGLHDMSGDGTAYLCCWISQDDGVTWTLAASPIDSATRSQQSIDVVEGAVAPPPTPPACEGVTATIDPQTMLITGTGTGSNATEWRVVRQSDGEVMDSGSGASASFSFTGEYGVTYQLQFGATP